MFGGSNRKLQNAEDVEQYAVKARN